MKRIVVRGPALSQSGYGEHTRFLLRALRSRQDLFEIFFINTNWGQTGWIWEDNEERRWMDLLLQKTIQYTQQGGQFDISLQVTIPNEWEQIATTNIGVTAGIETTKIAPQWVEKSLQMDKIIVVSEHAKYGFINTEYPAQNNSTGENFMAKTTCPVDVVNYPVKEIEPKPISLDLKYDFNFLTVGTWIPRKNLENTVKWFVEQFYDEEVGLIVKTSMARNCLQDREITSMRLQELLNEYKERKCEVYLLHGDVSEEEMTGLYQHPKVRSFVSLSHGEGFGLPLYEAAYNALPIIAPPWSGHCDFLYIPKKDSKGKVKNTAMFSAVSYDLKPVQESALWEGVIQKDSMWCFPKEWAAKKEMKAAIKNEKTLKSKAKKLQKYLKETFSAEQQYEKMCFSINGKEEELENDWLSQVESIVQEYA
tara:strand:- start:43 stop:1308 length:1266 start_codon:yes stop_codon:yes gene_type:complete